MDAATKASDPFDPPLIAQHRPGERMADVTGPISTLPGSGHDAPDGTMCDEHPDRKAVARIQGETDSFGSEMHDCCAECLAAIRAAPPRVGDCDWCKAENVETRPQRDIDEGMAGRVYEVCKACRDKYDAELRAELDAYDDWDDSEDDYDPGEEAMMNCSMGANGQCGQAGSEYCDFDCPYREE